MSMNTTGREPFFRYFTGFLLLFVIASFGSKAIFDADDLPPLTIFHHFHAITMGAWFVLFALQPTLIDHGQLRLHRLLGRISPLIVLAFLMLGIQMSLLNWTRTGNPLIITANSVNLTFFIGLYVAAIHWRSQAAAHKRLMTYATLMMMGPAAGRIPEIFDQSPFLAVPIILVLQFAPLAHDIIVHRRVHPATWVGFALIFAAVVLILGLGENASWAAVLETWLGPPGRAPYRLAD